MKENKFTNEEIGKIIGVSAAQASRLKKEGMPTGSIEEIIEWRKKKEEDKRRLAPDAINVKDDSGTLEERIKSHRIKVNLAGEVWEQSIIERNPNQGKFQTAYNQSLKTLLDLEAELQRRMVFSEEYTLTTDCKQTISKIVSEVNSRLDKISLDNAEKCNPENPALAAKVLEAWARRFKEDLSSNE
jgi:hypothetical protein